MSLQVDHEKTVPERENSLAVLILSNPPSPHKAGDWYWKNIAGVPFLLRNILSVQQGGVKRLVIFARDNMTGVEELCQRAREDSRVMVELECVWTPEDLAESVKSEGEILFLDGSAINSKTGVEQARKLGSSGLNSETGEPFLMDPVKLKSLAQNCGDQGLLACLRDIRFQETCSSADNSQEDPFRVMLADADENGRVTRQNDFDLMNERLLQASGLDNDSFMDRHFTRHISRYLTRQIIKTPITPNQLTLVSLAVGLEAAGCFLFGGYGMSLLGAALLLLSACIDCSDGEIARLKFMESPFGKRLDIICDNLVHIAVFFSIGMGLYGSTNKSLFIILGSLAVLGSLVCFIVLSPNIINSKSQNGHLKIFLDRDKGLEDSLANRDFTYLLFIMALIGSLDIFIGMTALGANAFAGYLLYNKFISASERNGNLSGR